MTLGEFFAVTKGSRQLMILGHGVGPLCGRDFWARYRQTKVWDAEIDQVCLVQSKLINDSVKFNGVLCQISLKSEDNKEAI